MFSFIKNAFTTREIRRRILFTLFIFAVFRLGVHIPVPGVDAEALKTISDSGILGLLNTFGGGALKRFSIFAMGVSPYITASIIMQLLQMDLVPKFTEWSKQGEVGRRKLNQVSTYLSIAMGFLQSLGLAFGFNQMSSLGLVKNPSVATYVMIALILTAGTMVLVWLGEQITRNGIGNGVSMIIFAGIVSEVPKDIYGYVQSSLINAGDKLVQNSLVLLAILLVLVLAIVMVVLIERAQRRIPIHHSKRASGAKFTAHLPLKINSAGVIPVIFASSFITTPQQIIPLFMNVEKQHWIVREILNIFNLQHYYGAIFYTLLLIVFTYFYALIQVNPEKVAENLQKQGAYIPSVRPGTDTENFLTDTLNRLSGVGSLYLVIIAVLPIVLSFFVKLPMTMSLSGTSLLIVVGVAIETAKQVEGRMLKRRYKGFLYL